MRNLVFIGSHLGYPMDRTPLGGGAMVGLQLVREWARAQAVSEPPFRLTVIGSGDHVPDPGAAYLQLPERRGGAPELVRLSELGYAEFCREFEARTTEHLLADPAAFPPERTAVVVNDISESPDLDRLAAAGYPILSIWHVDVVEFFNRLYLRRLADPAVWTRLYSRLEAAGLDRAVPGVLRLVFGKQRASVERSRLLVLPSRQMAATVRRCYAHMPQDGLPPLEERLRVVPWGGWREEHPEPAVALAASRLRAHFQIREDTRVLMTLSRISPEKGIHILLEALRRLEAAPRTRRMDVCLLVCGESAFMRGESYLRRVREAAGRLRRVRVFFPGYLSSFEKAATFRLAQLFVSPSVHESYGLTIVEALQAGLPVLASDHYGVDELLTSSYGRTVPYKPAAGRARRMAAALEDLLDDPAGLAAMGKRARAAAGGMDFSASARRLLDGALGMLEDKR